MIGVLSRATVAALFVAASLGGVVPSAQAADACPPASVGGKPVGWIEFDGIKVPLKSISYPAGGELDPPASAKVAGVSSRHKALLSDQGSTVIAWHVRYGQGCNGALNPLLKKKLGANFDIVTPSGSRQTYELVERSTVKRGQYQPEWFRTNGSPQVSLFTCSDLRNGKFEKTTALIAVPVNS